MLSLNQLITRDSVQMYRDASADIGLYGISWSENIIRVLAVAGVWNFYWGCTSVFSMSAWDIVVHLWQTKGEIITTDLMCNKSEKNAVLETKTTWCSFFCIRVVILYKKNKSRFICKKNKSRFINTFVCSFFEKLVMSEFFLCRVSLLNYHTSQLCGRGLSEQSVMLNHSRRS